MAYRPPTIRTVDERHDDGRVACEFCRFWGEVAYSNAAMEDMRECRRNPPALPSVEARLMASRDTGTEHDPQQGMWPLTYGRDWCGCFLPVARLSTPVDPPPVAKDPGRGPRPAVNAGEGEVPGE